MKLLYIIFLVSIALHVAAAKNLVKRECGYQECGSHCNTPCNSNNCNSQPCNNNCNSRPCNNNCNSQPCNSNRNCNQQPCNSNNCNQQPCNIPIQEAEDKVPILIPFPQENQTGSQSAANSVNNTNLSNITTTINLANTINTVNNISVPISVNSTNENTISVHFEATAPQGVEERRTVWDNVNSGCCWVTSPGNCTAEGKNCTVERRWECSDICRGIWPSYHPQPVAELRAPTIITKPAVVNTSLPVNQVIYQPVYRPVPIQAQPMIVQQPIVQQPIVQQPIVQQPIVQQPMYIQQPLVQQRIVQQPIVIPQPIVQRQMIVQQPVTYPVYQPAPRQQIYMRAPVPVPQRPTLIVQQPQVVPRTVVQQVPIYRTVYQPIVQKETEVIKETPVQASQGVLSRTFVVPYGNYYGGSYQTQQQQVQEQQQYMIPAMEAPCPFSNPDNQGYPSPCQQALKAPAPCPYSNLPGYPSPCQQTPVLA